MLFEEIRRIKRCGLVGGSLSLWVSFEVSNASARPECVSLPADEDVALGYCSGTMPAYCHA